MNVREQVAIGVEAEEFFNTPLGAEIKKNAQEEVDAALEALVNVDPTNVSRIIELQNIVVRFRTFENWMNGLIVAGKLAYEEYQMSGE